MYTKIAGQPIKFGQISEVSETGVQLYDGFRHRCWQNCALCNYGSDFMNESRKNDTDVSTTCIMWRVWPCDEFSVRSPCSFIVGNLHVYVRRRKEGKCRDFTCSSKADKINLVYHTNQTKKMNRAKQQKNRGAIKSGNGQTNPWDPFKKVRETMEGKIYGKGKFWVWSGIEIE